MHTIFCKLTSTTNIHNNNTGTILWPFSCGLQLLPNWTGLETGSAQGGRVSSASWEPCKNPERLRCRTTKLSSRQGREISLFVVILYDNVSMPRKCAVHPYFSRVGIKLLAGWPLPRQCEIPWWFAALCMLIVTHIMLALVLNTCMNANMQFTINSFRQVFPDKIFPWHFPDVSLIFSKIPDISLTTVKFPDISRFSRQVVTLC